MFVKISKTEYPPANKPVLVWDGACPFCRFWVEYIRRFTDDRVEYAPYQKIGAQFRDIPVEAFQGAVQFVEPDGQVFSGPDTAYRSLLYLKKPIKIFHRIYQRNRFFSEVSDYVYYLISDNRPSMYRLTVFLLGKNPKKLKPYGLVWLAGLVSSIFFYKATRR